jgi:hypothetical protein
LWWVEQQLHHHAQHVAPGESLLPLQHILPLKCQRYIASSYINTIVLVAVSMETCICWNIKPSCP